MSNYGKFEAFVNFSLLLLHTGCLWLAIKKRYKCGTLLKAALKSTAFLKMIDFKLIYDRRKEAGKNIKTGLIEIRASLRGERTHREYSTKIRVTPGEWSEKDKKVNSKNKDADRHNLYLSKHIKGLEDLQYEKVHKGLSFTFDDVKAFFKSKAQKTSSFISFVNAEIDSDLILKQKTKTQHRNTITILKKFTNNEDVLFSDFNYAFVDRFTNYLKGKGYQQNTIHKLHKNLKKFIELAIKKGFTDIKNPYNDYKVKAEQKPRDVLIISEVEALAKLGFNAHEMKLEQARDMFLFACYTGLRVSDVCALKFEYIKTMPNGLELDFFTVKVNKRAELPLHKLFTVKGAPSLPEQILQKYMHANEIFVFPKLSEQYINRHLKKLATMAGIKINLTFHIARETFGTYMASKIPTPTLKNLLQHSDIKTTMRYVHLNKIRIVEDLDKVTYWG